MADLPETETAGTRAGIVIVTGMSGAGKSSALKTLEDMGFEAVDNLPLSLLADLGGARRPESAPLAIGVDIRTRDFAVSSVLAEIDRLAESSDTTVELVFLDCDDEMLRRRYSETRRRHPLSVDRRITDGIDRERALVSPLRDRADFVIDSTHLELHELRRLLSGHFEGLRRSAFAISVISFSYRHGVPREADLVFDVRFLRNPHYEDGLRDRTGLDPEVGGFVAGDDGFEEFFERLTSLLEPLLPRFQREGKSYLTIAVGCTGGRHRSVFVAQRLGEWLRNRGETVNISHREIATES